jgi:Plasmid pRiA4b ORF-3-like protein
MAQVSLSGEHQKNPYTTLPAPTSSYIQLQFQLADFNGVYRTVKVPLNYTFANLHTLIQCLFGWNNSHLHQAHVYTHVEKYPRYHNLAGHMKRYGCPPIPPDDMISQGLGYEADMRSWNLTLANAAYYEVVPGSEVPSHSTNERNQASERPTSGFNYVERVADQELTLGKVWDPTKERNMSKGQLANTEIGVIYEYDLICEFFVHSILCMSKLV